jgi:copper transport protein
MLAVAHLTMMKKFLSRKVRICLVVLWVCLLMAEQPMLPVQAHANLVRSDPEAGAVLTQAPREITLEFSEVLDPSLTRVELDDVSNQVVVKGPGEVDVSNPRLLRLSLPALPDGTYTANWKARSAVDGHITYGAVGFSVGASSPPASLLPPPGTPDPATALPVPLDTLFRWLAYLTACMTAGPLIFLALVWRPTRVLRESFSDEWASALFKRLVSFGSLGLIASTIGLVFVQAYQASASSFGKSLLEIMLGRSGVLMGIRIGVLLILYFLIRGLPSEITRENITQWLIGVFLGAGALFTFSLQSHGAAAGSLSATVLDWIHLLSMASWMGGLLPLALLISHYKSSSQKSILQPVISRFSQLALVGVILLGLTGAYSAYIQVGTVEALISTTYGQALILKVGIFALLLILGAINRQILTPRLGKMIELTIRWMHRTVRIELLFGVLVLFMAGVLTGSAPAQEALQAQKRLGVILAAKVNDARIVLRVAPGQVGDDEFRVDVVDHRTGTQDVPLHVLLRFTILDHDMGTTQVEATQTSASSYTARGSYLSMVGNWQVEVILRRSGFDDIRHSFQFPVQENTSKPPDPTNPIPADAASLEAGRLLYQQDCLACHGSQGKGDGPAGLALNPHPADLTQHTVPGVHTDGQLYLWITNGYPGSAMPAFSKILTDEQRWHLVNFIRTLAR